MCTANISWSNWTAIFDQHQSFGMLQSTTSSTAQPAWGDNSCSDVTLILRRCEGFLFEDDDDGTSQKFLVKSCGSCSGPSAHPKYLPTSARVMHLHVSILSSASSFFEKMFTTEAGGWCPECRVVTCVLEGREFEAAQHVLRFTYTSKLPINNGIVPDGMLLIWMIKVRCAYMHGAHAGCHSKNHVRDIHIMVG